MSSIISKLINVSGNVTGVLPIANGGTAVTSVTTAPTASSFAGWDANKNFSADSFIAGYTTTATAAGTTTLTVDSTQSQYFTGSTTQTVVLPVTSTLVLGQTYLIVNNSTGIVTVQSSGANTVIAMSAGSYAIVTCILTSGTSAASWDVTSLVTQSRAGLVKSAGQLLGTNTNDAAAAGFVGEYVSSTTSTTSAGSGNYGDVTSISLTAGDWEVSAGVGCGGGSVVLYIGAGISTTTGNSATGLNLGDTIFYNAGNTSNNDASACVPPIRVSLSATTTYYLKYRCAFTTTPTIYGRISARRLR